MRCVCRGHDVSGWPHGPSPQGRSAAGLAAGPEPRAPGRRSHPRSVRCRGADAGWWVLAGGRGAGPPGERRYRLREGAERRRAPEQRRALSRRGRHHAPPTEGPPGATPAGRLRRWQLGRPRLRGSGRPSSRPTLATGRAPARGRRAGRPGSRPPTITVASGSRLRRDQSRLPGSLDGTGRLATPSPRAQTRRHLDRVAAEVPDLAEVVRGDALLHNDIRSDNLLLTPEGASS